MIELGATLDVQVDGVGGEGPVEGRAAWKTVEVACQTIKHIQSVWRKRNKQAMKHILRDTSKLQEI